jgi:tetratricopeptide (TPR) repeat protein
VSRAVQGLDGQPLFPGWHDLLLHAAEHLTKEGKTAESQLVQMLLTIQPPDYLEAAKRARTGLGPIWAAFLKEEIERSSHEAKPDSLDLARAVWELGSPLVVTTNYDAVLRWACPEHFVSDVDFWDIEAKVEQAHFLRSGPPKNPTIWHLHGRIGNADQIILTPDGYNRLYGNGSEALYRAALRTFQTLLASRSLLFVGFSFDDDALGVQLKSMKELFAGATGPHYALIHQREAAGVRALDLGIELIEFADFGEPLLDLLRQLGAITKDTASSRTTSTSPAVPTSSASYSTDNRPFFVPFRQKGDQAIGVSQLLQEVREQLTRGRRTSIGQTAAFHGIGGLGKTQLAVEYAWLFKDDYPNGVIWLTADQDISAQLTRLAVEARWVAPESEHQVKLDVAQHRVRSYSDCLVIFDNVEDLTTIDPYLPIASATPHLLLTSRIEQPGFFPIPMNFLDEEQSLKLLASEARRSPDSEEEEQAAREIARELGGLPLALEMAGAYLLRRPVQWRHYQELLRSNPKAALRAQLLDSFTRHEADLFTTLRIQEDLLEDYPLLRQALDVLTWSGSAPMGLSLLSSILDVSDAYLRDALSLGVQLRLLEFSLGEDRYGLHRLVRKVRQEDQPIAGRSRWAEEVCSRLGDWFFARRRDIKDLATFEAEIDHLRQWRDQAQSVDSPHTSRLTWLLAYPPYHRGQYTDCHRILDNARTLFEAELMHDPSLDAWLWHDLSAMLSFEGYYDKSLELNNRALSIRRQELGTEHPDTAASLSALSVIYGDNGDWREALKYETKALAIRIKAFGEHHPETVNSLSSLGFLYGMLKHFDKALAHFGKTLDTQRALDKDHPSMASLLGHIGDLYRDRGDVETALEHHKHALAIQHKVLGEEHPETTYSLRSIAADFEYSGDNEKALEIHKKILAIHRKAFGEDNLRVATTLDNIGVFYFNAGDFEHAIDYHREAFERTKQIRGSSHRDTIRTALNLARAFRRSGQKQNAFETIYPYTKTPPTNPHQASELRFVIQDLKSEPFKPGFRLPPSSGKKKNKKRRR